MRLERGTVALITLDPSRAHEQRGKLAPTQSGLRKVSYALVDQIRSVDKRRVQSIFGRLSAEEMDALDTGLSLFLGLS